MHQFKIIAHKGNTTTALQKAISLGADGVEIDVHLTKDNKLFVFHDHYFKAGDNFYLIEDTTSHEIVSLFASNKVLFLPSALDLINKKRSYLLIDIKTPRLKVIKIIYDHLIKRNLTSSVELFSSNSALMLATKETFPGLTTGLYIPKNYFENWMKEDFLISQIAGVASISRASVVHLPLSILTPGLARSLKSKGLVIHTHALTKEEFKEVKTLKCDQVTTDKLKQALLYLGKK